jgi:hypothetical protein
VRQAMEKVFLVSATFADLVITYCENYRLNLSQ